MFKRLVFFTIIFSLYTSGLCYSEPVNMQPGLWQICTYIEAPGAIVDGEIQSGIGSGIFCDTMCIDKKNLDRENVTLPMMSADTENCRFDYYILTDNTYITWKSICEKDSGPENMVGEVTYSGTRFESVVNSIADIDLAMPGADSRLPAKINIVGEFLLDDCSKKNDPQIRSIKPTARILARLRSKITGQKTTKPKIKGSPPGLPLDSIDFSSAESMRNTCAQILQISADSLNDDDSKLAFSICNSIELAKTVWKLIEEQEGGTRLSGLGRLSQLRGELSYLLDNIKKNREILQSVELSSPAMTIYPGKWIVDLDGDGDITPFERYFFWVPKRGVSVPGSIRGAGIYETYFENTKFEIDESDIDWAIAYCHMGETVLNILLSYEEVLVNGELNIMLVDEERMRNEAYLSAVKAIKHSKKLRESLLREKDDNLEWIPNADQKNSVFPITMNKQLFETWGDVLVQLEELLQGRTLWGGQFFSSEAGDTINLTLDLCSSRQGINIRDLFENPIKNLLETPEILKARCRKPSKNLPMSGMYRTLSEVFLRNSSAGADEIFNELSIARYIYWVN